MKGNECDSTDLFRFFSLGFIGTVIPDNSNYIFDGYVCKYNDCVTYDDHTVLTTVGYPPEMLPI